jgi:hypothetical protein
MFTPKTSRIRAIAERFANVVPDLTPIFDRPNAVYVDYGNVRNWASRTGWHIDLKRLKHLMDSFAGPTSAKFFYGTLEGSEESAQILACAKNTGYDVNTKPVKPIRLSIDVSSISPDSPDIVRNFISPPLLQTFSVEMIGQLNSHLRELNKKGITSFQDLKCNFDVEIGAEMLLDAIAGNYEVFSLWSCDSDFANPIMQLLEAKKRVVLFGISGMVARELNLLREKGLQVYEVNKLREMICWPRELSTELKSL